MLEKIIKIVSDVLREQVDISTLREQLPQWDSLKRLQIVMALDEEGISLPIEKVPDIHSVQDIVTLSAGR